MNGCNKLIGAILLVAGTTIGAGMLALPVSTGFTGFFPSLLLLFLCWLYMVSTAFLMLEVNFWMESHTNLISMARKTLGRPGEIISWVAYLFLLYALTTAYIAGSEPLFRDLLLYAFEIQLPDSFGTIPLLLTFGFCIYKGTQMVDYLNRILMVGLVVSLMILITYLFPFVESQLLQHRDWSFFTMAVPVVVTSFGFHIIIPSLTHYLDHHLRRIQLAILIGSAVPFIVYLIWEYVALGIIPLNGPNGILEGHQTGANAAHLISETLQSSIMVVLDRCFSFFALVTSFLGVSLALTDFLADGFRIEKTVPGKLLLYLLAFGPPLAIATIDPRAFLTALEYAGTFGVMFLLGLMPALMVWRGRYHHGFRSSFTFPGGKWILVLIMTLSIAIIGYELITN